MIRKVMIGLCLIPVWLYRVCVSPFKPPCCRFTPTCSRYVRDAFLLHGVIKGAMLSIRRLVRCNPWGGSGYDPVPLPEHKDNTKC